MIKLEEEKSLCDINVTPFIDVMLVLLIIFMVVTPLMTSSTKVELPQASKDAKADEKVPVVLEIDKNSVLSIGEIALNEQNAAYILGEKTMGNFDEIIYFYVDKSVEYEVLINAINKIKELGYSKIALSAEVKN